MKRILLYSPDIVGHPRVYVRTIADALVGEDCEVVAAMGFTEQFGLHNSPDLQPLEGRPDVRLVDNRTFSETGSPHLTAEELRGLQDLHGVDVTLFVEADKSNAEFRRIASGAAPRLRGRNIGIFANTAEWHPGEDSFTGEKRSVIAPTIRTTVGNVKRAIFNRADTARHFYERVIIGPRVLDVVLVKDERLARWRGEPVRWMPEISRPVLAEPTAEGDGEYEIQSAAIGAFLAARPELEPVLYFGDAAFYKGYDLFLEFALATPSVAVIHAGQSYSPQEERKLPANIGALREQLRAEGRLFETNAYVSSNRLKQFLFETVRLYVTTHRLTLSSSTMIQAIEAGRPVLMPDRGLVAHRIRQNGLGDTYAYGDLVDLQQKAMRLWRSDLGRFQRPMEAFWAKFSDDAVRRFFVDLLMDSSGGGLGRAPTLAMRS